MTPAGSGARLTSRSRPARRLAQAAGVPSCWGPVDVTGARERAGLMGRTTTTRTASAAAALTAAAVLLAGCGSWVPGRGTPVAGGAATTSQDATPEPSESLTSAPSPSLDPSETASPTPAAVAGPDPVADAGGPAPTPSRRPPPTPKPAPTPKPKPTPKPTPTAKPTPDSEAQAQAHAEAEADAQDQAGPRRLRADGAGAAAAPQGARLLARHPRRLVRVADPAGRLGPAEVRGPST